MVGVMATSSKRIYASKAPPRTAAGGALSPQQVTANPHLHRRPQTPTRLACLLWDHSSFSLGQSWCTQSFVCAPKSGVFVSPSSMKVLSSNSADLQSQIPWGFPVPLPDPQAGMPDVAL